MVSQCPRSRRRDEEGLQSRYGWKAKQSVDKRRRTERLDQQHETTNEQRTTLYDDAAKPENHTGKIS